jgi:hypothetical protein
MGASVRLRRDFYTWCRWKVKKCDPASPPKNHEQQSPRRAMTAKQGFGNAAITLWEAHGPPYLAARIDETVVGARGTTWLAIILHSSSGS